MTQNQEVNRPKLSGLDLTKKDFDEVDWQSAIENAGKKTVVEYYQIFHKKAQEANEKGNEKEKEIYLLLFYLCSQHLKDADDRDAVLASPFETSPASRGIKEYLIIEKSCVLQALEEICPTIVDSEMRARVSHIVYDYKRACAVFNDKIDYRLKELAVDAYLESALNLEDPEQWTDCEERYSWSLRLSASLGKTNLRYKKVVNAIEDAITRFHGENPLFLTLKLLDSLISQGKDVIQYLKNSIDVYIKIAITAAERIQENANKETRWDILQEYWLKAAQLNRLCGNNVEHDKCMINCSESFASQADMILKYEEKSFIKACYFMKKGILIRRRIVGSDQRLIELQRKLTSYQGNIKNEMESYSNTYEMKNTLLQARLRLHNKNIRDCLVELAYICKPTNFQGTKKFYEESKRKYIFLSLSLQSVAIDSDSKTIGITSKEDDHYFLLVDVDIQIKCTIIRHALEQLNAEHSPSIDDFLWIVNNSPFVPQGRQFIFARGLLAGIQGDFLISTHLLIPQMENSLRYILKQNGATTTKINDQTGVEEELDLKATLEKHELTDILGEDIVFDLKGLLIERMGHNLRNHFAHGLLSQSQCYSHPAMYLWWLTLKLCILPLTPNLQESDPIDEPG